MMACCVESSDPEKENVAYHHRELQFLSFCVQLNSHLSAKKNVYKSPHKHRTHI